jgi:serine/threonine protein kinase
MRPVFIAPGFSLTPFGRYQLVAKLAEGGMAEVFLAVEDMGDAGRRFVIIKRVRRALAADPDYIEYFLTEGRVALKVAHPHLPQAYELGVIDDRHYLAMEFIRGPTLLDLLRCAYHRGEPLAVRNALTVARAVAAALEHAHGLCDVDGAPLKIIHRDVNPQNVIVGYDGTVKLIDFGIANATVQAHETAAGVVKGKFSYLAPEQIRGRGQVPIDQRADLFSLGVLMHETLLGRVLFRAATDRETVQRVLRLPIPNPSEQRPEVPAELSRVVLRALERDPDRRYANATELLQALEQVGEARGLGVSLVQLRQEVQALVGRAHDYKLATIEDIEVEDAHNLVVASHDVTTERPSRAATPVGRRIGDADLDYFLAQAGVVLPNRRPQRLRTTRTDVEFSELLASLDRNAS